MTSTERVIIRDDEEWYPVLGVERRGDVLPSSDEYFAEHSVDLPLTLLNRYLTAVARFNSAQEAIREWQKKTQA